MENTLRDKVILITGGTGSFGKACTKLLLENYSPKTVRIYSRDELKQSDMRQEFTDDPRLRFFIGDVRDLNRLKRACEDVDIIIHAAALKQVPSCEYNPIEAIRTNVDGAVNVIDVALDNNVKRVVALSTDKAVNPINLYGATKLCAEKLFVNANNYRGEKRETIFSIVRYGNVMASRGSVIPLFYKQKEYGELTITDLAMTRFWITLPQAVDLVLRSIDLMREGKILIPKLPSMRISDLAHVIAPNARIKIIGQRPGEKIHEYLITKEEARYTYEENDSYIIAPHSISKVLKKNSTKYQGKKVEKNFEYNSMDNPWYLKKSEISRLLLTLTI